MFHVESANGNWGWARILYFRRRLLATLVYGSGCEGCGQHLSVLVNIGSAQWAPCITLPLDRLALSNTIGRIRRVFA